MRSAFLVLLAAVIALSLMACEEGEEAATPTASLTAAVAETPTREATRTPELQASPTPTLWRTEVFLAEPPATPSGEVAGSCGPSLMVRRPHAWRCTGEEDNAIRNPCFSETEADTFVVCYTGERINLTEPLPVSLGHQEEDPSHAMILQLVHGTSCLFMAGATGLVGDERANYWCDDDAWIVGYPEMGPVWVAHKVWLSESLEPIREARVPVTKVLR
ncbi:MAG: hypothetical protein ACUVV3_04160 [Dehalococcoidia bacterium]